MRGRVISMTEIKICGLSREEDISFVNEAKPDYIGFILYFPKSRRNIDPERAAELKKLLLPDIKAVGVFVDQNPEIVMQAAKSIPLDIVQLHGHEDEGYIRAVREETGIPVWKAFRIESEKDLNAAQNSSADAVLLDSGYGTGKGFDWDLLKGFKRPFILAGGLTPENISGAVRALGPATVDLSSGVETGGCKDREKILSAVRAARQSL